MDFLAYKKNVFSENGEDGIIEKLFQLIGSESRVCCEFGAWDGMQFSNTRKLVLDGWTGIFIEGDPEKFKLLKENYKYTQNVFCINKYIDNKKNKLSYVLAKSGLLQYTENLDFLNIDIDGLDYELFHCLDFYPRVICIEIRAAFSPYETRFSRKNLALKIGQPFAIYESIAKEKGYGLVCYTGNAFYVREDILKKYNIEQVPLLTAYTEFINSLSQDQREWYFIENLGLGRTAIYCQFNNPFLEWKSLGITPERAIKILKREITVILKETSYLEQKIAWDKKHYLYKLARFVLRRIKMMLKYVTSKQIIRPKVSPSIFNWMIREDSLKISTRNGYLKEVRYYLQKKQKFEDYLLDKTNPPKTYLDLKFAVYFQCFNQKEATSEALKSLRKFYPEVPVHLVSDKGEDFTEIAKNFNCDYSYAQENLAYWPCKDMIAWFRRLYDTCQKYKDVDWIVLMEDDVRVRDKISKYPNAHLAGQGGWGTLSGDMHLSKAAKDYIWRLYPGLEINGFSGCGGSIFHKESFIKCFNNIKKYDTERFRKLDGRLLWATDISFTFLFNINGFITRRWLDLSEDSNGELKYGPASAFDHQFKKYYNLFSENGDLNID